MNVTELAVTQEAALVALGEYKKHRDVYDQKDWEVERIYRAISKGKTVISGQDSIRNAGLDEKKRPRLAICQAHAHFCRCYSLSDSFVFGIDPGNWGHAMQGKLTVPWPGLGYISTLRAALPRIPPQHRPHGDTLSNYHMLWEADWTDLPRDPYLLRRIGRDAFVVLAAWDLTPVEMNVLRSHRERQ